MMKPLVSLCLAALLALPPFSASLAAEGPKPATEATRAANQAVLKALPFSDKSDFDDAKRGFIAAVPGGQIKLGGTDRVVWDQARWTFLENDNVPDTANPSLWRQGQLNHFAGLFKVTDHVYQYRGMDIANMSIIEGDTGLIIIDPLIAADSARAGLELYYEHVPTAKNAAGERREIKAILYTHPHLDHFGGVRGVLSGDAEKDSKIAIIAPAGFLEHAISENLYAGTIMMRRAIYMYGRIVPPGPDGHIGSGLGTATTTSPTALVAPTDLIANSLEQRIIDGVEMEFAMSHETEAPVEFTVYFPQYKAFCAAEITNSVMHNVYTLRGAQVRNSLNWWRAIDGMIDRYGDKAEVVFGSHNWPRWGKDRFVPFLEGQRDVYKYLHDQTLRLANLGYTSTEIAESIKLPKALDQQWHTRGYYGSVSHNAKAIYQLYLGWFDGNPANLNPLPPEDAARRYVEFMGGADAVLKKAQASYDAGDYRWVAEVVKHVVFADPNNTAAKNLLADSFEQMGYQAESGPWRNFYLTGARDLRNGVPDLGVPITFNPDTMRAMTPSMVLDYLSVKVNPERSDGKAIALRWVQPDVKDAPWDITLRNSVLLYRQYGPAKKVDATITADKVLFIALMSGTTPLADLIKDGKVRIEGSESAVKQLIGMLDPFSLNINIVTP